MCESVFTDLHALAAAVFGIIPVIATLSAVFGPALLITAAVVWKCD